MDETEARHRTKDVANAAALVRDAAQSVDECDDGPMVVHTPYGRAEVHTDRHGADVTLPGGATVHVRKEASATAPA
jgi:hypothetical protein